MIQYIERYLGGHSHVEQGDQYMYFCPSCNHHNPRFSVNYDKKVYKCWKCGFSGHILYLLKSLGGTEQDIQEFKDLIGYVEKFSEKNEEKYSDFSRKVRDHLFKNDGITTDEIVRMEPSWRPIHLLKDELFFYKKPYNYLRRDRGLSDYEIKYYDFRYDLENEMIVIPSHDKNGNLNYYVKRSIHNSFYLNYEDRDKTEIVFFDYYIDYNHEVILTEGVFDAIKLGYNSIPLLGTFLSQTVLKKLVENETPSVVVMLDDDAGDTSKSISLFLKEYGINSSYILIDKGDAGSMKKRQILDHLNNKRKDHSFMSEVKGKFGDI